METGAGEACGRAVCAQQQGTAVEDAQKVIAFVAQKKGSLLPISRDTSRQRLWRDACDRCRRKRLEALGALRAPGSQIVLDNRRRR